MRYNRFLKCNVDNCIERNGCILPEQIAELQDKLSRRNMQIKELKKQINLVVDDLQKTRIKLLATEVANMSITNGALSK